MDTDNLKSICIGKSLTVHSACEAKELILTQLEAGTDLHINLSEVEEADTTGAQLLVAARAAAEARGASFSISSVPEAVVDVLSSIGLCIQDDLSPLS